MFDLCPAIFSQTILSWCDCTDSLLNYKSSQRKMLYLDIRDLKIRLIRDPDKYFLLKRATLQKCSLFWPLGFISLQTYNKHTHYSYLISCVVFRRQQISRNLIWKTHFSLSQCTNRVWQTLTPLWMFASELSENPHRGVKYWLLLQCVFWELLKIQTMSRVESEKPLQAVQWDFTVDFWIIAENSL